jgi:hypothetical protein
LSRFGVKVLQGAETDRPLDVHGSVHRDINHANDQQDATV